MDSYHRLNIHLDGKARNRECYYIVDLLCAINHLADLYEYISGAGVGAPLATAVPHVPNLPRLHAVAHRPLVGMDLKVFVPTTE